MIADTTAYVSSLLQVFSGAAFLILALPLLMWRGYLKGKPYSYRFIFCVITQNCFLINLVLLLGFLGLCNRYTVTLGIVILFLLVSWNFSDRQFFGRSAMRLQVLRQVARGEKPLSSLLRDVGYYGSRYLRGALRWPLWKHLRSHWIEYLALGAAIVYNIWFLTYNVLHYHSYQFSDIPVHQSWIYALDQGRLFSDGIYPFGMHAIVYLIHNLFFLDLLEVLLYFGAFQTVLLLLSVYVLSKKIFQWKYASILVLILFSLLLNQGRYAAALPEECGVFAAALAAYCLIGFLHTPLDKHVVRQDSRLRRLLRINQYVSRRYLTKDALLFMLCVSLCIAYHFYTALAACMLVFSVLLAHLGKAVRKQYWVPIFTAGVLGVVIAVTPLMACFARGIPFQESMQWAVSVMTGQKWEGSESNYQGQLESALGSSEGLAQEENAGETAKTEAAGNVNRSFPEKIRFYYEALYDFSKVTMFGDPLTKVLTLCIGLGFGIGALFLLVRSTRLAGMGYLSLTIYAVAICTMGAAQALNLMQIVAAARASAFAEPFLFLVYAIPADIAFRLLGRYQNKVYQGALSLISAGLCAALILTLFRQGWVHKFFDVNLAYYNEAEYLTRRIRETYPANMFTIVSPTEEYYQVVDYGYHVELSQFMNMVNGNEKEFKITTPYVFFFIEKHVLQDYYYGPVRVDPALAAKKFVYYASSQDYYFQRAILESQAYYWAQRYLKLYPNAFQVYFENDIYVAYILEQNPYSLYDFQINYLPDKEESQ